MTPHHPVVLSHRSLHACVLNSLALSLVGVTKETPEPPGGTIDRDLNSGEPTGLLLEMLGHIREKVMPSLSEKELVKGAADQPQANQIPQMAALKFKRVSGQASQNEEDTGRDHQSSR